MTVKTNGAEMKRFFADRTFWPKDAYYTDEKIVVDGDIWNWESNIETIYDQDIVTIAGGTVFMDNDAREGPTMEAFFRKWRKAQRKVFYPV